MGAATATVYDASPPHQNPPILAESAQPSAPDMAQLFDMLAGMKGNMQQMNSKMDGNTQQMNGIKTDAKEMKEEIKNGMKEEMKGMRGEMQQIGRSLQAGIKAIVCSETQTAGGKMAPPRAGTSELGGGVQRLSGPRGRRVKTG